MASAEEQAILLKQFHERSHSKALECSEENALRFLVGWSWDLEKAFANFESAAKWRADTKPHLASCPEHSPQSKRCVGFDLQDRPVLYTCFGQAKNRFNAEHNVAHLCRVLEDVIAVMDKRRLRMKPISVAADVPLAQRIRDGRWVLVVDYEGFGMSDCSPKTMNLTNQLMQNYPERLALCVQLDAPFIFSAVWRMVLPLLPEVTASKISFLKRSELRDKMAAVFGPELMDWLEEETAENRDAVRSKDKQYWEWLDEEGRPKKHDARGAASWVSSPEYQLPNCTDLHCKSAKMPTATK